MDSFEARRSKLLARERTFFSLVGAGGVALVVGVLALGGTFFDVGDPASSEFARLVLRLSAG